MVTRQGSDGREYGPNQRITVDEAIRVWTLDGAFTTFEENPKGSISPGKLADFVVLRADPRRVPVRRIKDIVVDAVYVAGQAVFNAPPGGKALMARPPTMLGFGGDGDEHGHDR